jgi:AraC family transcriptional regulator
MEIAVAYAASGRPAGLDIGAAGFGRPGCPLDATHSPPHPAGIIEDETQWRLRPSGSPGTALGSGVMTTRWRSREERAREVTAETPDDCHVVGIALRSLDARLSLSGRAVLDGAAMAGALLVTAPSVRCHCVFRGPYDALHLHVPNELIAECAREMTVRQAAEIGSGFTATCDPELERLGRALLGAEDLAGLFGQLYVDCISTAIIVRLLVSADRADALERPKVAGLVRWRLKRAIDYIEARLAEPVSLADIAMATGLTRVYFSAQFKAATGLRPHEYLVRRRIERAQEMLVADRVPIVDVALSVGFQTQAHFSTVFKRFVGQSPHAWRQSQASLA